MTYTELADTLEGVAMALRKHESGEIFPGRPLIDGEYAVGGALLWGYLHDTLVGSPADTLTKADLIQALMLIAEDTAVFPPGLVKLVTTCERGGTA